MEKKTDAQRLDDLLSYIESHVECVEQLAYSYMMAFTDIVHFAERLDDRLQGGDSAAGDIITDSH